GRVATGTPCRVPSTRLRIREARFFEHHLVRPLLLRPLCPGARDRHRAGAAQQLVDALALRGRHGLEFLLVDQPAPLALARELLEALCPLLPGLAATQEHLASLEEALAVDP